MTFDYSLDFATIDFRKLPELYRIGKGEQGVLLVEPYKSEILPYWRFKTPQMARNSANRIYRMFLDYQAKDDSWEWTWPASFCRWVTHGHEDTRITSQAVSTPPALENYCIEEDHEKAESA